MVLGSNLKVNFTFTKDSYDWLQQTYADQKIECYKNAFQKYRKSSRMLQGAAFKCIYIGYAG